MKTSVPIAASLLVACLVACGGSGEDTASGGAAISEETGSPPSTAGAAPRADAATSAVGLYVLEETHRTFAVKITALSAGSSDLTFSLGAAHDQDTSETVVQRDLDATQTSAENGKRTFTFSNEAGDCVIRLTADEHDAESLDVQQEGACPDLGFPELGDMALPSAPFVRDANECFDVVDETLEATCKNPL
jgi:hypothetical protein